MHLGDRIIVLTGAANGIGFATLQAFAAAGATVIAVDLDAATLRTKLPSGGRIIPVEADVSTENGCEAIRDAAKELGRVDVLVNNAGVFPTSDFAEISYQEWSRILRINLDSVFLVTSSILPLMKGRGWGRIVNIGSASVFRGVAKQVHYVTAKAGVIGFSRSLARALGPEGITVNIVTPGLTSTPGAMATFGTKQIEAMSELRALPRQQVATDLVGAVMFLASPAADFITGQILNVDGGSIMH